MQCCPSPTVTSTRSTASLVPAAIVHPISIAAADVREIVMEVAARAIVVTARVVAAMEAVDVEVVDAGEVVVIRTDHAGATACSFWRKISHLQHWLHRS